MFTETELRDALEHSAARAETIGERAPHRRPPRRFVLPAVAAASVAVLAVGAAVLDRSGGTGQPSGGTSVPAVVSHAATPTVRAGATDEHVPVDLTNAVDLIQVTHDESGYLTVGGNGDPQVGSETFSKGLSGRRTLDLTVVDSGTFDPGRIPRDRSVPIAGTTGFYARFTLFPLDANTGPGSDKYTAPWTIAFLSPLGKWVFVSIENGVDHNGVDDPGTIAAEYESLGVRFVSGATRLPFRTGFLPDGYAFGNSVLGYGESMTTLESGDRSIEIDVLKNRAAGDCVSQCGAYKRVGDYTVNVVTRGYVPDPVRTEVLEGGLSVPVQQPHAATALEHRILDSLTLASDLGDPSTYWTIADALG